MLFKILVLPFWVAKKAVGLVGKILKIGISAILGIFHFTGGRVAGAIFGALAGAFLGRKHVGIKIFSKKR